MRLAIAAAMVCVLALVACGRGDENERTAAAPQIPAPAAPILGFTHEDGFDAQGYYRPAAAVGAGDYRLAQIAIGAPSDFEAWEGGKREEVFGPILMEFEDITSPVEEDEMGRRHAVRLRVTPLAYRLSPGQISFHGKADQVGEIDFEGSLDTAALAQARTTGASDGTVVLAGKLRIGERTFDGLQMSYWSGDGGG